MTNQGFKPEPTNHTVEVLFDGKTHKGENHLEHDYLVVSYQRASKMIKQGADNYTLARTTLEQMVNAKHGRH